MTTLAPASRSNVSVSGMVLQTFVLCALFHFLQYACRSAPGVMVPELSASVGLTTAQAGSLIGSYYYTYSLMSVVAGGALDKFGVRWPVTAGMLMMAVGCLLFGTGDHGLAYIGRLLQGAGAAFAFTGAVYVATRGLPAARLASAVGIAQAFGMFGGSAGQLAVARLMHGLNVPWTWIWFGFASALGLLAVVLLLIPRAAELGVPVKSAPPAGGGSWIDGYRIVFGNPQSWLCGLCAGLLFVPTTVGDMIWRVPFFTEGLHIQYERAVLDTSVVLFGWVIGCPLLGWISDRIGRRKPVVIAGSIALFFAEAAVLYGPVRWADSICVSLIFGIVSGAALLPYTIIKEINPSRVAGTATGIMNLMVFATSAAISPIVSGGLAHLGASSGLHALQFRQIGAISLAAIAVSVISAFFIAETGQKQPA